MIHFSDADVEGVLRADLVQQALREAFIAFAAGGADMQARARTEAGGVKLSTLGAVLPGQGCAGAKVYATIAGRFNFVIVLFSAQTGAVLASFDAGAITRWRTAAVSVLAAQQGANPVAANLALFGTGVQARAHLEAFARAFPLHAVRIVSRGAAEDLVAHARSLGLDARAAAAEEAVRGADIIVTATRSRTALFDGAWVRSGTFVAAVGSSLPDTRELDDTLISRAAAIVVEWREQALREAGDLVLAKAVLPACAPLLELGDVLAGSAALRRDPADIVVFKSVGVGLEDIAIAGLACRLLGAMPG